MREPQKYSMETGKPIKPDPIKKPMLSVEQELYNIIAKAKREAAERQRKKESGE